mmetsp:Transcript_115028/g.330469  ORF Transcript_115028/g.330469 Transcript_115028/m.330469 type:complete len:204 (+) Transcript_115028:539-1150(+)
MPADARPGDGRRRDHRPHASDGHRRGAAVTCEELRRQVLRGMTPVMRRPLVHRLRLRLRLELWPVNNLNRRAGRDDLLRDLPLALAWAARHDVRGDLRARYRRWARPCRLGAAVSFLFVQRSACGLVVGASRRHPDDGSTHRRRGASSSRGARDLRGHHRLTVRIKDQGRLARVRNAGTLERPLLRRRHLRVRGGRVGSQKHA